MTMVTILADMPEVLQRVLVEHIPDAYGRCWECRDARGVAEWPCVPRMIADDAERLRQSRRWAHVDRRDGPRYSRHAI